MTITIDHQNYNYSYVRVDIDFYNYTRNFIIRSNDETQDIKMGAKILIEDDDNKNIFAPIFISCVSSLERIIKFLV